MPRRTGRMRSREFCVCHWGVEVVTYATEIALAGSTSYNTCFTLTFLEGSDGGLEVIFEPFKISAQSLTEVKWLA